MAEMQFVDAQGAGEIFEGPLPIGGHVDLTDFPIEAVVEKTVGEVEEELALERLLQAVQAHAVFEQAIDDHVPNAVGVVRSWFDAIDLGTKGLATRAAGAVFSDGQFDDGDFAESDVANASSVDIFAPADLAALWTGESFWGAAFSNDANARLNGFHACVPPGLVW
jgi:hypothetical protein